MTRRGSTLHDVARYAGVSTATVSRVVRNIGRVSDARRQRVLEAIDHLGYRPSHVGRALASRRHDTLGFIVPGLVGPFFAEVVHGCTEAAVEVRKSVLIYATHLLPNLDLELLAMTDRVDGLLISGGTIPSATLRRMRDTGIPMVLLSQHPELEIPTIRVDNKTETRNLVRHLIEHHGHRRFAFAGSATGSPDAIDRWEAVVEALVGAGIEPPAEPIPVGFNLEGGHEAATSLLAQPTPPDALICGNDELAIGAIGAFKAHGVRVPDDIAVTGWDDISIAAHASPALTTVRQFTRDLGREATEILLSIINGERASLDEVLPCDLVIRESCGCPPPTASTRHTTPNMSIPMEGGP